jgi:hypothetical protein
VVQDELQRFTLNHEQAFVTVLPCLLPRLKTNMSILTTTAMTATSAGSSSSHRGTRPLHCTACFSRSSGSGSDSSCYLYLEVGLGELAKKTKWQTMSLWMKESDQESDHQFATTSS